LARRAAPNGADQHRDFAGVRPGEDHLEDKTVRAAELTARHSRLNAWRRSDDLAPPGRDGNGRLGITHGRKPGDCSGIQSIVVSPPLQRLVREIVVTAFADWPEASRALASRRANWG
jgi:hypothetical protein